MKLFTCPGCGGTVHFSNNQCTACGAGIGFAPGLMEMVAPGRDGAVEAGGRRWRKCSHYAQQFGCNWMVGDDAPFCLSCRLNRTIPDLSQPGNRVLWQRLEEEKRRLVYAALRLGLPVMPQSEVPEGLAFDFLADPDPSFTELGRVLTGHAGGLITINIAEADPVARERMRAEMAEPYRTILGHFRHESGHYYWERLVRDTGWLGPFRASFGDEQADYGAALQRYHAEGPPPDWPAHFVSAYATSHPWEDWAESWSHYLHMIDTLETAWSFGLRLDPRLAGHDALAAAPRFDPCAPGDFDALVAQWLPLTVALNALTASLGHEPAYPFMLGDAVLDKFRLIHRVVHDAPPAAEKTRA
jgi:hypothetical protein